MSATLGERAGVIVVRAWLEKDGGIRARVTAIDDLSSGEQTASAAGGIEEIVGLVRTWLERLAQGTGDAAVTLREQNP